MLGLGPWWFNFSQLHRSELTVNNLISVPSPYIELTIFGTFKTAEFFSFVGIFKVILEVDKSENAITFSEYHYQPIDDFRYYLPRFSF